MTQLEAWTRIDVWSDKLAALAVFGANVQP